MAYVCQDCGLVRNLPKRFCVRCKGRNVISTNSPFGANHPFSADDDGVPPPPTNTEGNPEETTTTPTSELTP